MKRTIQAGRRIHSLTLVRLRANLLDGSEARRLEFRLCSNHVSVRPPVARRSQPDALCRIDEAGAHSGLAARDRPSRLDRPAGRRSSRACQPRHSPPAVEREIPPDREGHQADPQECSTLPRPRTSCGPTRCPGSDSPAHPGIMVEGVRDLILPHRLVRQDSVGFR